MDRGGQDGPGWTLSGAERVGELAGAGGRSSEKPDRYQSLLFLKIPHVLVSAGGGKHAGVSPQECHGPALGGRAVRAG